MSTLGQVQIEIIKDDEPIMLLISSAALADLIIQFAKKKTETQGCIRHEFQQAKENALQI